MPTVPGKIGHQVVAKLQPGDVVWDGQLKGFGARRSENFVTFVLMYRTRESRQRWYTIGKYGSPWTPDAAREEAKRLLYEVARGGDPAETKQKARHAESVEDLCAEYMEAAANGRLRIRGGREKKASTLETDRSRIRCHVVPILGRKSVVSVTQRDCENFMHQVAKESGKPGATRALGMLGAIFQYAVKQKIRLDNPVRGVERFADRVRARRLTEDEYGALGAAIRANGLWPAVPAATKFIALTGWRSGEALCLRRADVDFARRTATLGDTKTGRSIRPLSHRALEVLKAANTPSELFFAAPTGRVFQSSYFSRMFRRLIGDMPKDITPHILRHSFASLGNDLGFTDATVGALLGHVGTTITSRYQHSSDPVLLKAADAIADATAALIGDNPEQGAVVPFRRGQHD